MAKKKKAHTTRLQKAEAAHQRNEFLKRLKLFCDAVSDPTVFALIPPDKLEEIYVMRHRPVKLEAKKGQAISAAVIQSMKDLLFLLKKSQVAFGQGSVSTLSVYDFLTVGMTLILHAASVKDTDYPNAALVKLKLSPLAAFADGEAYAKGWETYRSTLNMIGIVHNDLASQLYVLQHEAKGEVNGTMGLYNVAEVYAIKTEKIQVMIQGANRPVFRLGMPFLRDTLYMDYPDMDAALFGLPPGRALPVYAQSHALDRLTGRMDGVERGFLHLNIYLSLKNPRVCQNSKGEWLVEYRLLDKKAGYFKADPVEGKLVFRTFLFLTNNGTPEGETLRAYTGLMKEDKQYLSIDKFSSFLHSDLQDNEQVKNLFIRAGCGSLFEIDKAVCLHKGSDKLIAGLMEAYLKQEDML